MCFVLALILFCTGLNQLNASDCCDKFKKATEKKFKKYKSLLEDSTWIVPPTTLLAIQYTSGTDANIADQTVWTIDRFENGYFFGNAYIALNASPTSQMNLVGSITPYGDVYITFYPASGTLQEGDIVVGIGRFVKIHGDYTFIMQTSSGPNNLTGISHWSYMISVDPDDYFYQNLPSIGLSVPQFINEF